MANELFTNLSSTTVSSGGTTAPAQGTTESWTVASSASFPAAVSGTSQFHIQEDDLVRQSEIILVTNVSGTTWSVTRGAEGTTPVVHPAGFTVVQTITGDVLTHFLSTDRITFAVNASPPSAPVTNDLWVVSDVNTAAGTSGSGVEIDSAERATTFDIQAVGTVATLVEGLSITIPPQSRPHLVTLTGKVACNSGTAAIAAQCSAYVLLEDNTTGTPVILGTQTLGYVQVTAVAKLLVFPFVIQKRFPPSTATRIMAVSAKLVSAAPGGWSTFVLYGGDPPINDIYEPILLTAVTL